MPAPRPKGEEGRLAALRAYQILDTASEQVFDDLAQLASVICRTPIALLSLIDAERQWFKARMGITQTECSRDVSFCSYAILQSDLFIIPDALQDPRFATNPLVVNEPKIRFYAGIPLFTADGTHALGTLCVLDFVARELTGEQMNALRALARQAEALLELSRQRTLVKKAEAERSRTERELQMAYEREPELARVDLLTGLINRRAFLDIADRERKRSQRYEVPMSVITFDLENLQRIREQQGDQVADALVVSVANLLRNRVRHTDVLARTGDAEFVVLLPTTATESAKQFANKIRELMLEAIQQHDWPLLFAISVVTHIKAPESLEDLIRKADHVKSFVKTSDRITVREQAVGA
ncbi:MAG: sensor domain-containing diguanylate cyclase [Acidobacteriia bacterium]|nr:sensor domain-containing diguanylate cyclase [Terriglobia bacterium]